MSWVGCQINPIDVDFHLQNKNSTDKIGSKNDKEIKVSPLMPIRVKLKIPRLNVKSLQTDVEAKLRDFVKFLLPS